MAKRRTNPTLPVEPPKPDPKPLSARVGLLAPLVLVAVGFLAYHNSFTGRFLFDDIMNLQNNFQMRRLWPIWEMMWGPMGTGVSGRPVVQITFALNYALHGLDVAGYHVGNLVLHAATGLALYGVVRRTLTSPTLADRFGEHATVLALLVAAVWQAHPLLSDSVTYVSGRTEILAALFMLLTLYAVIRSTRSPRRAAWWQIAAVVFCVLGTGCKEIMAAGPFLILLYDRMFVADSFRQILRERKMLYAALFASLVLIPLNLQMADFHRSALATQDTLSSWAYLKTQAEVLVLYLRLSIWPRPLIIDYSGWPTNASLASVLPEALFVVALLAATVYGLFRRWPAAYAGAWFFFILAPTSSFLPLPTEIATERRMYLPLMGLVSIAVLCGYRLLRRIWETASAKRREATYVAGAIAVGLVGLEIQQTVTRNEDYKDPLALWADVVVQRPSNSRAHNNLALEMLGRKQEAVAKELFLQAIRLDPTNYTGMNNLATIYMNEGNRAEATQWLQAAIKIKPDYSPPYVNLGLVQLEEGRFDEAERYVREAIRLQPGRIDRLPLLAQVLTARGSPAEAERACRAALRADPNLPAAHDQLGMALAAMNRFPEAVTEIRTAVALIPLNPEFNAHLSWWLAVAEDPSVRNVKEAVSVAARAVEQSRERDLYALDALALAQAADGQFVAAVETAKRALALAVSKRSHRAKSIGGRLAAYTAQKMPEGDLREFGY